MDDSLLQRYSRHILLDDIGLEGQQRLAETRVLVVGAGGLGCPASLYLASAGVGEIDVYDADEVDLTNLQRQILHFTDRVGDLKSESARRTLSAINPHCRVNAFAENISDRNVDAAVTAADIVVDCCDSYGTRHLVNRACVRIKKPLVFGAAAGFDGQTAVFDPRDPASPCYNCLFSEADEAPETRCALMGVFAPLTGVIGSLQAAAALKLAAMPAHVAAGKLIIIEARAMSMREVKVPRDPACAVCGTDGAR